MLKSVRKSKNRYFYHIFVSPGDAPGAITLNVVWMEREFDAYKLSCCMCPSNYKHFWDRARYLWKNRHFIIPSCIRRPLGGFPSEYRHPLWYRKTRMVSLPDGQNISKICLFVLTWSMNVSDGQTDRQTDTAWQQRPRLCIASRGNNMNVFIARQHSSAVHTTRSAVVPKQLNILSSACGSSTGGAENAGPENTGPNVRDENCSIWKCRNA